MFYFSNPEILNSPNMSPVMQLDNNYNWVDVTEEFFTCIKGRL